VARRRHDRAPLPGPAGHCIVPEGIVRAVRAGMPDRQDKWPIVAMILYALSLVTPAIMLDVGRHQPLFGFHCLEIGWLTVAWYANVVLAFAVIARAFAYHGLALVLCVIAVMVALTTFAYRDLVGVHVGFFAWIGSMLALAVASARSKLDRAVAE
jgi:hypothetical protein